MDSESEKAGQVLPDQENDIILPTKETSLENKIDKKEEAFEVNCFFHTGYNEKFHRKEIYRSLAA